MGGQVTQISFGSQEVTGVRVVVTGVGVVVGVKVVVGGTVVQEPGSRQHVSGSLGPIP